MSIKIDTIIRTACLILAIINNALTLAGKNPLPIDDEQLANLLSQVLLIAAAVWTWWKNNSFTKAAIMADEVMHDIKAGATIEFSSEEADG